MKSLLIGLALCMAACSSCGAKRTTAKIGTPERGTRFECKSHKVVNDPAKCE